jgi:hypothetical protein
MVRYLAAIAVGLDPQTTPALPLAALVILGRSDHLPNVHEGIVNVGPVVEKG